MQLQAECHCGHKVVPNDLLGVTVLIAISDQMCLLARPGSNISCLCVGPFKDVRTCEGLLETDVGF